MIQQPAAEGVGGNREPARRPEVGCARTRIPTRVVVRDEDRRRPMVRGVDDDLAEREVDSAGVAAVAGKVQAARLLVEMGDPKAFLAGILLGEAAREELPRRCEAVEGDGDVGTLISHQPRLIE